MNSLIRLRSRKQLTIILVVIIALICAVAAAFAYKKMTTNSTNNTVSHEEEPGKIPRGLADRIDVEAEHHDPGATQTGVEGVHTSNESAGAAAFPTTQPNLSVVIKSTQQSDNMLLIDTVVEPTATGTCIVELTRDGQQPISKSTKFSGSSCTDTSLSLGNAIPGVWNLTVKVIVASNVATATKAVTLQ